MSFDVISYTEFMRKANKSSGDIDGLQSEVDTLRQEMDALYPGFSYQGSVAKVSDLPSGATTGQTYTVVEKGNALYLYNGSEWVQFDTNTITNSQIDSMYHN